LHHQLLALGGELPGAYGPGIELAFQFSVAAVRFLKIYLSLSRIHPSPLSVRVFLIHPAGPVAFLRLDQPDLPVPDSGN
jgi:hypothetical protein